MNPQSDYAAAAAGQIPPGNPKNQFLIASAIGILLLVHSSLSAGVFAPLSIMETKETNFPGGTFVYKSMQKDYAASFGAWRTIVSDLIDGGMVVNREGGGQERSPTTTTTTAMDNEKEDNTVVVNEGDLLYTIFIDDESYIPGGETRFASGVLLTTSAVATTKPKITAKFIDKVKKWLLDSVNQGIESQIVTKKIDGNEARHSKYVKYQLSQLPRVSAAVAYHPFNDGVWSAVLQSFKIIPKFKKYYSEQGKQPNESPIIIANCCIKQGMCTYYMPLEKRDKFLLGMKSTKEYAKEFDNVGMLERMGLNLNDSIGELKKIFGWSTGKKDEL